MQRAARFVVSGILCLALVVPTLLSGCTGRGPSDHLAIALSTLGANGVAVYDSYEAKGPIQPIEGPRSAMRLTRWQLTNMVAQADAGMGMLGADIDRMEGAHAPKRAPTFSYFIAAWITRGASPLARYAQQIMGDKHDYHHAPRVTFPLLVVTLFIADAARMPVGWSGHDARESVGFERFIAAPADASGVCSTVASFISQTVTDVENALTINSNGFFATLWNVAIKLVAGLAEVVIGGVLYPLLAILNAVAGGLAALTAIASSLQPWTVTIQPQPDSVTLGAQPVDGKVVAILDAPSINWPSEVTDCAQVLTGVQLDKISYHDAPITWEAFGDVPNMATVTAKDDKIGDDKQATLSYSTATRDVSNAACESPQGTGFIGIRATVERIDVVHAQEELAKLAFSQLPPVVRNHLMPLFGPMMQQAEAKFAQLVSTPTQGLGSVDLRELKPDPQKCTPSPSASPAPSSSSNANDQLVGAWGCVVHHTAQTPIGPIAITVRAKYLFGKNGIASGAVSPDATWSGMHNVSVGNAPGGMGGSGPFTYTPTGSHSGTLHMDGADHQLTWSSANAWSMPIHSQHFSGTLHCAR